MSWVGGGSSKVGNDLDNDRYDDGGGGDGGVDDY